MTFLGLHKFSECDNGCVEPGSQRVPLGRKEASKTKALPRDCPGRRGPEDLSTMVSVRTVLGPNGGYQGNPRDLLGRP